MSNSEGIRHVTAADIAYAQRLGFVIKLLGHCPSGCLPPFLISTWRNCSSGCTLTLVPESHPLASVNDVYNAILVEGDPIGQVDVLLGPGALGKARPPARWWLTS